MHCQNVKTTGNYIKMGKKSRRSKVSNKVSNKAAATGGVNDVSTTATAGVSPSEAPAQAADTAILGVDGICYDLAYANRVFARSEAPAQAADTAVLGVDGIYYDVGVSHRVFARSEALAQAAEEPLSIAPSEIFESIIMETLAVALRDDEFEDLGSEYDEAEMFDDGWFGDLDDDDEQDLGMMLIWCCPLLQRWRKLEGSMKKGKPSGDSYDAIMDYFLNKTCAIKF